MVIATKTMVSVRDAIGLTTKYSLQGAPLQNTITIDDFARVEVRVGKVLEATNKEGSEKLIRLVVDFGVIDPSTGSGLRTIFTGVRGYGYTPEDFLNKQFFFITNLAYRKMMDEYSQGMIMAVDGPDKKPQFISAEGMTVGAKIR